MTEPIWEIVLRTNIAQHRHLAHHRFVQMATVDQLGNPANRTMTVRDFDAKRRLIFTTDVRSAKMRHIRSHTSSEIVWYFEESRTQFRLAGTLQICDAGTTSPEFSDIRRLTWAGLSDAARELFAPADGVSDTQPENRERISPGISDDFAIIVFAADRVDMLDLRRTPHERHCFEAVSGDWIAASTPHNRD